MIAAGWIQLACVMALQAAAARPSLLEAHYTATLVGTDLIGRASWRIATTVPAPYDLEPLTLALTACHAEGGVTSGVTGGETPILERANGRTRLFVQASGTYNFSWSARGIEEPGMVLFDLHVPNAPIGVLDLALPRYLSVVASELIVTGPLPGPNEDQSYWRVLCGGQTRLKLQLRSAQQPMPFRTNRIAVFEAADGRAQFDFHIDALRGPVRYLKFMVEPGLRIFSVQAVMLERWEFQPAAGILQITLREPVTAHRLSIFTSYDPTPGNVQRLPAVHADGPLMNDLLNLRIHPDWVLAHWDSGDYVPSQSAPTPDRGYILSFRGTWASKDGNRHSPTITRRLPAVLIQPAGLETRSRLELDWQIGASYHRLTARVMLKVLHGPLARLQLQFPPSHRPGSPRMLPDDPAADITIDPSGLVAIEPSRPWVTGQVVELVFEAVGDVPAWTENSCKLTVPSIRMLTPGRVDAELTVRVDSPCRLLPNPGFDSDGPGVMRRVLGPLDRDLTIRLLGPEAVDGLANTPPPASMPPTVSLAWKYEALTAQITVEPGGGLRGVLTGTVRERAGNTLNVALPPGARLETVRLADRWLDRPVVEEGELRLSLPANGPVSFAMQYRLTGKQTVFAQLPPAVPRLPDDPSIELRWESAAPFWLFNPESNRPWIVHYGLAVPPAVIAAALVGYFLFRRRRLPCRQHSLPRAAASSLMLLPALFAVLFAAAAVPAQPPMQPTPQPPLLTGAIVTQGFIEAWEEQTHLKLSIRLDVRPHSAEWSLLRLPIKGLLLEHAAINDVPAYPTTEADGSVWLRLAGLAKQTVLLQGRVPIAMAGAERECRLPVEALPIARLVVHAPAGVAAVSVPERQGALTMEPGEPLRIAVDLGSVAYPPLRWRSAGTTERPARPRVRSATIWDVASGCAQAQAIFDVRTDSVGPTELVVDLPADVEPGQIRIRCGGGSVSLRSTQVRVGADGRRRLVVQLHEPLPPAAQVSMNCYAMAPVADSPQLFPVQLLGADAELQALILRTAEPLQGLETWGCQPLSAEAARRAFGPALDGNFAGMVQAFEITSAENAWLRPRFQRAGLPEPRRVEAFWSLGAEAEVETRLEWASPAPAVAFELPAGISLAEVRADELAGWSQRGQTITAWFRTVPAQPRLTWFGQLNDYQPENPTDLPVSAGATFHLVQLRPNERFQIELVRSASWRSLPSLLPGVLNLQPLGETTLPVRVRSIP